MRVRRLWGSVAVAVTALAAGACIASVKDPKGDTAQSGVLRARRLIEKYGVPDEVHYGNLVWNDRAPWRKMTVRDIRPTRIDSSPGELGVIEQTVAATLTPAQTTDLAGFGQVAYNPRAQELSARSDREELNFLRLNLAADIINRRLTAEQARGSYADILSLEQSGKISPYLQGLLWTPGL